MSPGVPYKVLAVTSLNRKPDIKQIVAHALGKLLEPGPCSPPPSLPEPGADPHQSGPLIAERRRARVGEYLCPRPGRR